VIRQIDPEYIAQRVQPIKDLYTDLEQDLIESIAKRIAKTNYLTSSAAFELEKLEQMRLLDTEAIAKIAAVAKKSRYMIEKLITDAGYFVLQADEELYRKAYDLDILANEPIPLKTSPRLQTIMRGAINNAKHTINFTNSQAHTSAQKAYYRAANKAYMETYSGMKSITNAIHDAVVEMAKAGITEARYIKTRESGKTFTRHDHIDVAVRRNIVTSVNQANGELCLARSEEWGNNLVEVSKHVGERPTHAVWSGKIYAIDGEEYGEYGHYANLRDVTGYGTAGGLKGVNCRHTFGIFIEGVSTPVTYPDEWSDPAWQAEKYKESQAQRKYEREIRSLKREIAGLDAIGEDHGLQSMKLRNKQNELKSFISQTGRTRRTNREQVVEFNRSVASKSTWAGKRELDKYTKYLYNKDGTIVVTDDHKKLKHPDTPQDYKPFAVVDTISSNGTHKQVDRTFYDESGKFILQVHSSHHGKPDLHPYGGNGEHSHVYTWGENQSRTTRDLNDKERKENKDILW